MSDAQIVRKDQITLTVCEIGFVGNSDRVSRNLFHIFLMIQVINLKFCTCHQYWSLCFIVFLHDL